MALRNRGGIWHIDIKVAGIGRFRKSTRTSDHRIAKELHDLKLFEMQAKKMGVYQYVEIDVKKIKLSTFILKYEDTRLHLSKNTRELDGYAFNSLLGIIGDKYLNQITLADLRKFKKDLLVCIECKGEGTLFHKGKNESCPVCNGRGGHSPTTFNMYRRSINVAFESARNWDGSWGYLKENLMGQIKEVREIKKSRRSLSIEEIKSIFKVMREDKNNSDVERFADLVHIYLALSLRRNEALMITAEDLHYDTLTVTIRNRKNKEDKVIPLPTNIIEIFKKWENGNRPFPYKPDFVTSRFKKYARKAGIPDISVHSLRHTTATLGLYHLNINPRLIQDLLGHSEFKTTEKYITSDPSRLVSLVDDLSTMIQNLRDSEDKDI